MAPDDLRALTDAQLAERLEHGPSETWWRGCGEIREAARRLRQHDNELRDAALGVTEVVSLSEQAKKSVLGQRIMALRKALGQEPSHD